MGLKAQELGWGTRVTLMFLLSQERMVTKGWNSELLCWVGGVDERLIMAMSNGC